jgi:2-polyprenyl-3-methyl-5-hydroxy-6-metoxy-1,4-benzoquinol methylase
LTNFGRLLEKVRTGRGDAGADSYAGVVRRRTVRDNAATLEDVFDSPEALAINDARMAHLRSLDLPLAGKTVIDVGCGVGHLAAHLAKLGCTVTCVDGREKNIKLLRQRHPEFKAHVADAERDPLDAFGKFDIVFSYGLLYHLENPMAALRNMAAACREMMLLETIICDHTAPLLQMEDEYFAANEALSSTGCRPTPSYVALALNRCGFGHVYTTRKPPGHEDFQFEWMNDLASFRDGHPLRAVFVASRTRLDNSKLKSMLKD